MVMWLNTLWGIILSQCGCIEIFMLWWLIDYIWICLDDSMLLWLLMESLYGMHMRLNAYDECLCYYGSFLIIIWIAYVVEWIWWIDYICVLYILQSTQIISNFHNFLSPLKAAYQKISVYRFFSEWWFFNFENIKLCNWLIYHLLRLLNHIESYWRKFTY